MANVLPDGAGIIVGVGVGAAASAALEPAIEIPKQEAWNRNANKVLPASLMARLVAQGGVTLASGADSAQREGFAADKFDKLVYLEQTVPGLGEATALWRLGLLSDPLFSHVLTKAGLDTRYVQPLINRKTAEVIGLGDIAYAVVRGILPAPSYVPVPPPTHGDLVPRFPQVNLDPDVLAAMLGYDPKMLEIMVGRSGLSMAPGMAAQALFRGIIGPNDYLLAIAEGDLRTEWGDPVREVSRQILTSGEYAELELRGFHTRKQRLANTAKHGMSTTDSDDLYNVLGRAPGIHAVTTGLARGGTYDGQPKTIPQPYLSAVERANIRPEWYDIEYANRHSYPSAFVLRSLLQGGVISATQGEQYFLDIGWPPQLALQVAQHYGQATTAASDPHVVKAQTQLWNTTHASYKAEEIDAPTATGALTTIGVAASAIPQVLALWDAERTLIRSQLTPAQVRKALNDGIVNPATGAPWSQGDALAALLARGYSQADATVFLQE